ncbi:excitatory amino acid transporter 3-like [Tetranychus urticae]|uniref:Amino acid transporter n=1 Tax=Tetranychus urticae TaxID=32264 RepID=T1JXN7_TETUR|nr:excitatory amino acid transporter 3-like [Tetranychus urticae]XP_015795417.1 excitatory amino acid transporter 3-like [Tetranychus urticae]
MGFLVKVKRFCLDNILPATTMISVVTSVVVGILLRNGSTSWTERQLMYIEFPGTIFLRCLKCLIIPIMVTSLISSLANLDSSIFGKIGRRAVTFYLTTTFLSIVLGIVLVMIIKPGKSDIHAASSSVTESPLNTQMTTVDTVLDLIRNIFPSNPVEATIFSTRTVLTQQSDSNNTDLYSWDFKETLEQNTNIMGIVLISLVVGIVIAKLGEATEPLRVFFTACNQVTMVITTLIIKATPIGVFFLILPRVLSVQSIQLLLETVGWYTFTVLFGIALHASLLLPSIYFLLTRKNPYSLIMHLSAALLTGFGTSSSTATLPLTMQCLEEKAGIDSRITRSLLPIGSVINMDGTALYEAVAALFIAQLRNVDLTLIKIIITSVTATAASIGAAGIPQAGLVTMVIVLNALGLPASDISLIYIVDWFLDRFRTVLNIMGDSFGAAIIAHISEDDLKKVDERNKENFNSVYFIAEQQLSSTPTVTITNIKSKNPNSN